MARPSNHSEPWCGAVTTSRVEKPQPFSWMNTAPDVLRSWNTSYSASHATTRPHAVVRRRPARADASPDRQRSHPCVEDCLTYFAYAVQVVCTVGDKAESPAVPRPLLELGQSRAWLDCREREAGLSGCSTRYVSQARPIQRPDHGPSCRRTPVAIPFLRRPWVLTFEASAGTHRADNMRAIQSVRS